MENNEIIEVNGTELATADQTEMTSGGVDLVSGLVIGAAAIGGAFLLTKVVKPIWSYGRMKLEAYKEKKAAAKDAVDPDIVDSEESKK